MMKRRKHHPVRLKGSSNCERIFGIGIGRQRRKVTIPLSSPSPISRAIMSLSNYSIYGLIFAICCFHSSPVNGSAQCTWTAADSNQNRTCRPGQAISHLKWKELGCGKLEMSIQCINVTNSCHEVCEWRPICSNSTQPYQYIRGIQTFYDIGHDKHRAAFHCCTAKNDNHAQTCRTPLKHVQTAGPTPANSSVYLADGISNETSVYIVECKIEHPVHQLCPLTRMKTEERPRNGYLYGLFGLAGLAGLSGLALVKYQCKSKYFECEADFSAALAETYCKSVNGQFDTSVADLCTNKCPPYPGIAYFGACCSDEPGDRTPECDVRF